jgi:CRISPR/Cas system-associated exonuclease Cas4 (RecB family)
MKRAISFTESGNLLTCQAQWDFNYGGYLAGDCLKPRAVPTRLQEGSAWGAGVAAFHAATEDKVDAGIMAIAKSLDDEAEKLKRKGVYDAVAHSQIAHKLRSLLEQYAEEEETRDVPLEGLGRLEEELLVPLPSRSGKGDSNRYFLQVFFDGVLEDADGRIWLVEFKLREQLSALELITNGRQIRYYAWAYEREYGRPVAGVIVDERLNAEPKPPKIVNSKKGVGVEVEVDVLDKETKEPTGDKKMVWRAPSTDKAQLTTPELYKAACEEYGVEVDEAMVAALGDRQWSQRQRIFLSKREVEESGTELVSLGRQVAGVDSGEVYPVRNVKPQNCKGCRFREICNDPHDTELVDSLFDRRPPKRDRDPENKEAVPA